MQALNRLCLSDDTPMSTLLSYTVRLPNVGKITSFDIHPKPIKRNNIETTGRFGSDGITAIIIKITNPGINAISFIRKDFFVGKRLSKKHP